jgi:hypothetical protein
LGSLFFRIKYTFNIFERGRCDLYSDFKDFEDALQNYSAELNKEIDIIITRNIKDFKYSKLAVMTPDQFLKTKFAGQ